MCRTLESISTWPTEREEMEEDADEEDEDGAEGSKGLWRTMPAPSLLALPSRPRAR